MEKSAVMRHRSTTGFVLVLLLAGGLGACGRTGELDQPGPLFGARARADAAAGQRAVEARSAASQGRATPVADQPDKDADNAPFTTRDMKAPQQDRLPISKEPIPGTNDLTGPTPSVVPPS
jgi:hypothetical protein